MANSNDFINAIDELLSLSVTNKTLSLNSTKTEKLFEIYILCLIKKAITKSGGQVTLIGINSGDNPQNVIFRAAPGAIYSTTQDFTYLLCTLNNDEFEIHVDVEYEGSSGATHEMDISLIEHTRADRCRTGRRNARNPLLIVECKFFSSSTPSIGLARALVGLTADFTTKIGSMFVSSGAGNNMKTYLSNKGRPDLFEEISPLKKDAEERFVISTESKLRKWAAV